jgi:hypothetical protein
MTELDELFDARHLLSERHGLFDEIDDSMLGEARRFGGNDGLFESLDDVGMEPIGGDDLG